MIFRALSLVGLSLSLAMPVVAQQPPTPETRAQSPSPLKRKPRVAEKKAGAPKSIGTYDDWIAATYRESDQTVCYAFTRAQSSAPEVKGRGSVVLTVTQRTSGRDAVALEAGFLYAANATVTVQADQKGLDFYTAQRNAFARNGREAVAAFESSSRAIARSPGPRDVKTVTDSFSLKGFKAAYSAINKACPGR